MSAKSLSAAKRSTILLLGLPSFGLALSVTAIVTFVPVIAKQFSSSTTLVGSIIAIEGVVALFLPVLAGTWSDHLRTRLGGRLPFLVTGFPIMVVVLGITGFARSLPELVILIAIFFLAYYLAYEPYRALYPDLIEDKAAARAQSIQAMWRGLGTGVALTAGGFLLAANNWLPFLIAAIVSFVSLAVFLLILLKARGVPDQARATRPRESIKETFRSSIVLLRDHPRIRAFMLVNALWELTLAAIKTFILLYLTSGLGRSKTIAATVVTVTSVIMFLAAPLGGKMGDRYGKAEVSRIAALIFGVGMLLPVFFTSPAILLPEVPIAAMGGAIVMTLPYAILMPMMPKDQHGKLTGIYSTSRGVGLMLGPVLAGVAISLLKGVLPANGYSAMWLVCSAAMLLSAVAIKGVME